MSFQQGLSGLNATSKSLEVIGNNIANANTYGAKSSRAEFSDMYATAMNGAGGVAAAGIGVSVASVAQQFNQGNITTTTNPLDMAINGRGFFQIEAASGETVYSRNGQFKLDRDGFVVNGQGLKLKAQVWDETAGRGAGDAVPIQLQTGLGAPVKTGAGTNPALAGVQLTINLDARKDAPTAAMAFDTPESYNFSTSQTLFDGQGAPLTMAYYFRKTATDSWDVYGSINGQPWDGVSAAPATPGPPPVAAVQMNPLTTLSFSADGVLTTAPASVNQDIIDPRLPTTPTPTTLFSQLPISFEGTSQYAAGFSVSQLKQDGYASGELTGMSFDSTGVAKATFSNGRSTNLAQIQLTDFSNLQGLQPLGANLWQATYASGDPVRVGSPGSGVLGSVQAGALEESNVDLTGELVNMITAQRLYQANSQTIKTQDQVLQTLVNLR
jgi:flagellar hook protein FlgE